jgi:poly(glycerol-phosphate) alpha-glucosyltransferase
MKIATLIADTNPSAGGLYHSVRGLSSACASQGHDVQVFAMGEALEESRRHWQPLKLHDFRTVPPHVYGIAPGMIQAIKDFAPDIIHTHGIWTFNSLAASLVAKKIHAPIVVSPRGMLHAHALKVSRYKKKVMGGLFENRFLRSCDCVHALNEVEAQNIRNYGLNQPISVVPNGVSLPDISACRLPQLETRDVVFVGRIHPIKNIGNLIRAWARFIDSEIVDIHRYRLTIAGWQDGNYLEEYQQLARSLGCSDRISWPGPVHEDVKSALLKSAYAFVLPSLSEGHPMSVIEAWSYGVPVLMTPECNIPQGYEVNAAIRIETDVEGILEGLVDLANTDAQALAEMGGVGRELVSREFEWSKLARQMLLTYEWLLEGGSSPECLFAEGRD